MTETNHCLANLTIILIRIEIKMVSSITLFIVGSVITANNVINAFTLGQVSKAKISTSLLAKENNEGMMGRRGLLQTIAAVSIALPANAIKMNTVADGLLPDLPPEAQRSYLQYRVALQVAADYYLFDLQEKIGNIDNWGMLRYYLAAFLSYSLIESY